MLPVPLVTEFLCELLTAKNEVLLGLVSCSVL